MGRRADHADERAGDAVALDRDAFRNTFEDLSELARRVLARARSRSARSVIRQTLAQFYIDVESMKYLAYRNFSRCCAAARPGPEGSISKVLWSELNQRMNEFALVLQGPRGGARGRIESRGR